MLPKLELGEGLVGEGVAHHEGGVTGGAAEIHEAAFGEDEDGVTVGEDVLIDLRLDIALHDAGSLLKLSHLDLVIKMTDVANDGLVFHLFKMVSGDDVAVAGAGHIDVAFVEGIFHGLHLEAFHSGLECADGVDFGDDDAGAVGAHGVSAALAHIAVAAYHHHLTGDHHVGGAFDTVGQRLAAAVQVVELRFGDGVVHVDGGEQQFAAFHHLVEAVYAGGSLFGNALQLGHGAVPALGIFSEDALEGAEDDGLFVGGGSLVENCRVVFGGISLMNHEGGVAAVVHNQLGAFAAREGEGLGGAPPVVFERFALPCEHGHAGGSDGCGGMVLRGEDVAAAPAHVGAEGH